MQTCLTRMTSIGPSIASSSFFCILSAYKKRNIPTCPPHTHHHAIPNTHAHHTHCPPHTHHHAIPHTLPTTHTPSHHTPHTAHHTHDHTIPHTLPTTHTPSHHTPHTAHHTHDHTIPQGEVQPPHFASVSALPKVDDCLYFLFWLILLLIKIFIVLI